MFASDLDPASRAQLAKGARLIELLKQKQASPMPVEEQVVVIWAGTTGQLDDIPVADIRRFESEFLDFVGRQHQGIFDEIRQTRQLGDETVSSLEGAVDAFYGQFTTSEGESLQLHEAEAEAMDASERGQERVQVKRGS